MSKCDTVVPLIYAMKKRRDAVHVAAETIKKLFDPPLPELVDQVCQPAVLENLANHQPSVHVKTSKHSYAW